MAFRIRGTLFSLNILGTLRQYSWVWLNHFTMIGTKERFASASVWALRSGSVWEVLINSLWNELQFHLEGALLGFSCCLMVPCKKQLTPWESPRPLFLVPGALTEWYWKPVHPMLPVIPSGVLGVSPTCITVIDRRNSSVWCSCSWCLTTPSLATWSEGLSQKSFHLLDCLSSPC